MMDYTEFVKFWENLTHNTYLERQAPSGLIRESKQYKLTVTLSDGEHSHEYSQYVEEGTEYLQSMTTTVNALFMRCANKKNCKIVVAISGYKARRKMFWVTIDFKYNSPNRNYENVKFLHRLFGDNMFDTLAADYLKQAFLDELKEVEEISSKLFDGSEVDFERA